MGCRSSRIAVAPPAAEREERGRQSTASAEAGEGSARASTEEAPAHDGGQGAELRSASMVVCPVCDAKLPDPAELDVHLVKCMARASIGYNVETLAVDVPTDVECQICLEEFSAGQVVARLGCLCMFHKGCVDGWFRRSRSCPSHPDVWRAAREHHA